MEMQERSTYRVQLEVLWFLFVFVLAQTANRKPGDKVGLGGFKYLLFTYMQP